ncbi:tripartite tricarboxylate transporter substrate binding protein [Ramlibacter ginsenosidimutans]|uniref:Tripartite tricarboxylate transporter substrate binding protein n=1 Tax=Ramlibacter ginsenosidimutans TaxID=502333 RepID=A0A934WQL3_9BURK|nr:tripartite tricarboxylate transporter substrate binding protein [Ramlibacter ginsenosidimutans]MBK6009393.1 tripartite tricarboxylate transporter substrate binding protein [Ramlibacter ginsenosidimutans]
MIPKLAAFVVAAFALAGVVPEATAQGWPNRMTITVVVPLAPGDGGDMTARAMSEVLASDLEAPVVVVNKPGAGGALGVHSVISAHKDGYVVLFTQNSPLTIRRVLDPATANYDPLKDLVPLAITTRSPSVLVVRKDAPFRSFQEMVAYARRNPGRVRIGNAGPGSAGDLSVQVINSVAGTDLDSIPYKGAAPAVNDVIGGQVEGVILALGAVSAQIRSGTLRAIAISSEFPELPEVPTLTRLGYRQDLLGVWFAWMLPAGVPDNVVQELTAALHRATRNGEVASRLQPFGLVQDWEPASRVEAEITREYDMIVQVTSRLKKP